MPRIFSLVMAAVYLAVLAPMPAATLVRVENCAPVDDHGPIRAIGVNWTDGFWNFAQDGNREAYLPDMDAPRDRNAVQISAK
jgi:hypothetical protein